MAGAISFAESRCAHGTLCYAGMTAQQSSGSPR
jgi:hypothetical protein